MASAEAAPFARVGDLGEVTSALCKALARRGHEVALVLPRYLAVDRGGFRTEPIDLPLLFRIDDEERTGWIHQASLPGSAVTVYFVVNDHYYNRQGLYQEDGRDYPDNLARFTFFCRAVLDILQSQEFAADIVHCHDWPTALIPAYLKINFEGCASGRRLRTVFTLHNIAYQGFFPKGMLPTTGLPREVFTPEGIEFYGDLNLLKAGFVFSDHITTVSERYAAEIMSPEYGMGMESIVAAARARLTGILNGVDYEVWNPVTDPHLPTRYDPRDLSGKVDCKARLQEEFGLPPKAEAPLLATMGPLSIQHQSDIIPPALEVQLLAEDVQCAALVGADSESARPYFDLQRRFPAQIGVRRAAEEGLAHRLQAGADLFLMPSRYEPCRLTELTSMKYGTPPVVRQIGGMAETVRDYNEAQKDGYGFVFHNPDPKDLLGAVRRALAVFRDKTSWVALQRRGMAQDFSWDVTASRYEALYHFLLEESS